MSQNSSMLGRPAPMLGVLRPQIYRFKLGSFEVTQILDGFRVGPGPHPTFGQDQSAETVHNLLKVNGLPATNFEHHFVPTLVNTGKELVLFDAGNGKGRVATAGHLRDLARVRRIHTTTSGRSRNHPWSPRPHRRPDARR